MSLILSIDTAVEKAGICLALNGEILSFAQNKEQKDHASWIHSAIRQIFRESGEDMHSLKAVAVTAGPGSYTGLRVGMATAKGLCFALQIPLITESTLRLIALAVKLSTDDLSGGEDELPVLICPMIDARRMEVFTATYDLDLKEIKSPSAMILDDSSFMDDLKTHKIAFCGNGSNKWKTLCYHKNAFFSEEEHSVAQLAQLADIKYKNEDFTSLAYAEPAYLKNFYMPPAAGNSN